VGEENFGGILRAEDLRVLEGALERRRGQDVSRFFFGFISFRFSSYRLFCY
jgi:hypothetical protein